MESILLQGLAIVTLLIAQMIGRRAARARQVRERGEFLAERIDEVNQKRLLFRSDDESEA